MKRTLFNYYLIISLTQSEHHSQTWQWWMCRRIKYSNKEITFQLINWIILPTNGQKNAMVGLSITRIEFQKNFNALNVTTSKKKHQAIEVKKNIYHQIFIVFCFKYLICHHSIPFHRYQFGWRCCSKCLIRSEEKMRREIIKFQHVRLA